MQLCIVIALNCWCVESALAQNSKLSRKTRNSDYTIPLSFSLDLKSFVKSIEFEYNLTQDNGNTLWIGDTAFNERSFNFHLKSLTSYDAAYKRISSTEVNSLSLIVNWPQGLFDFGTLEMISKSGTSLWKYEITAEDRAKWKEKLLDWKIIGSSRAKMKGGKPVSFAITDLKSKNFPISKIKDSFRFCISLIESKLYSKLCSGRYSIKRERKKSTMVRIHAPITPRVIIQNEDGPLSNVMVLPETNVVQFYADLASGSSYEFIATPSPLNIVDVSKISSGYTISGWGALPTAEHRLIKKTEPSKLTEMLGFESTIKDDRVFWQAKIPQDKSSLCLPGKPGGLFKYNLALDDIPGNEARLYLHERTVKSTYLEAVNLYGEKPREMKVTTDQFSATEDKDPSKFVWTFKAAEKGEHNRSVLNLNYKNHVYYAQYELYRGMANELSARFTGLISGGSLVLIGEVAYNRWFEEVFGWENYWLAKQRWGVNIKYFKSLSQLTVDSDGGKGSFDVMNLDFKYRFTPGMWTREETVGAMYSYQDVTFGTIKTSLMGAGIFWARSMPKVFDDLFNYLPLMEYPKWVDMEFIYFPTSLKKDVKLGATYALNFHGQVLWKKNLFGEAGFGMKKYALTDDVSGKKADFNIFYGTVGMGLKF